VSRFPLAIGRLNGGYTEKIAQHFPKYSKYNFKYTEKKIQVLELRTFVLKISAHFGFNVLNIRIKW